MLIPKEPDLRVIADMKTPLGLRSNEDEYESIGIVILSNVNSLRADLSFLARRMRLNGFDESKYQSLPGKRLDFVSEMEVNLSMVKEFMRIYKLKLKGE